jgi:hypothetical protein
MAFAPVSDRGVSGSQQQVELVGPQGPSVTGGFGIRQDPPQPLDEIIAAGIARKTLRRSMPRQMTCCRAPGASMCALRGMIHSKHGVISIATHENRGVPYRWRESREKPVAGSFPGIDSGQVLLIHALPERSRQLLGQPPQPFVAQPHSWHHDWYRFHKREGLRLDLPQAYAALSGRILPRSLRKRCAESHKP